jgi:hypothetical protein
MSNSLSTTGRLKEKRDDCVGGGGDHMGGENHNRLLLQIPSLSLGHIFRSSVFPQAHASVNLIETHFHFI